MFVKTDEDDDLQSTNRPEDPSERADQAGGRSDEIGEQIKEAHRRRGKFGLATLFVVLSGFAILVAVLKPLLGSVPVVGLGGFVLVVFYLFSPLCCWLVASFCLPRTYAEPRPKWLLVSLLLGFACGVLAASVLPKATPEPGLAVECLWLLAIAAVVWTPQVLCIVAVQYLFQETNQVKRHR